MADDHKIPRLRKAASVRSGKGNIDMARRHARCSDAPTPMIVARTVATPQAKNTKGAPTKPNSNGPDQTRTNATGKPNVSANGQTENLFGDSLTARNSGKPWPIARTRNSTGECQHNLSKKSHKESGRSMTDLG